MATITGTTNGDTLTGTGQADRISGLGGADWLTGLGGNDELDGGAGADLLDGGDGFDTASYRTSASGVIVRLNGGFGKGGDAEGDGLFGIEGVIGSAFDDFLVGKDGERNVLRGGNGKDVLYGLGGDDELEGGAGGDTLDGFDGFDFASYASSNAGVGVDLNNGNMSGGHAAGDLLLNIEGVIGSAFDDVLFGNAGRNVFRGGAGNDTFFGIGGDDELRGGSGIDTASFRFGGAVVADLVSGTASGQGTDRMSGIENLTGSIGGDQLAGNGGANVLAGGEGRDFLIGRGGADRFDYNDTIDSRPDTPDLIQDFSRTQGDKIDLSGVDARVSVVGNQTFSFIGQAQFTAEGQVRAYQQGGDTFIEVNTTTALPGAEMVIMLDTGMSMQAGDFIL